MPTIAPLSASRLHATFDPSRIPWENSEAIPLPRNGRQNPFQPRAMDSLFSQVHNELERVIIKGVEDGSIVKMDSKAAVQVIISLMVGSNRTRVLTPYAVPTLYEEVLDFISRAIKP